MLSKIQRIPAGMMLVPMFLSACINTFAPGIFEIGSPFSALFSAKGTMGIVAMLLVFTGITTDLPSMVKCMKKSGPLILLKLLFNILTGILFLQVFGKDGIFGISSVAFVACLCSYNAGLYLTLMQEFGDDGDVAGYAIISITGLPFIPVCVLGFASGAGIDFRAIAATVIPFLIGVFLRMMDKEIIAYMKDGTKIMIPFLGFCLGASVDFLSAAKNIVPGLLLFGLLLLLNNLPLFLLETGVWKGNGSLSMAISAVAGLALTVPQFVQESVSTYSASMETALSQIAFAVILSSIFSPLSVKYFSENNKKR